MRRGVQTSLGLLSRGDFRSAVFQRSGGRCVFCDRQAVDAHHILDRKLFVDGGYRLNNGASVCEGHHWECETTRISVEATRLAAGVSDFVVPQALLVPPFAVDTTGWGAVKRPTMWDKWGNVIWPSGLRSWGPLEHDLGARRALTHGGVMHLMMPQGYRDIEQQHEHGDVSAHVAGVHEGDIA